MKQVEEEVKHVSSKRKICVVLVDRANYGRLKPVMRSIADQPELELQVLAAGTMVLGRFGRPVDLVRKDGFPVSGETFIELEGSTPATMAKSVGFGVVEFSSEFQRLKPDVVLLIGDRYEALAAAIAAAYMNICIVHVQGGEVSGSIDESARHAISKFSHFHFPATQRSADYLIRMGEAPDTILGVGCPSSDLARLLTGELPDEVINATGSGAHIDLAKPFQLVIFHPTTTRYGAEHEQMENLLAALDRLKKQTILLWPNIDAGSDAISKVIRVYRDHHAPDWLRTITNLLPENYLRVLARTSCAIGNSSSFVRDAGYNVLANKYYLDVLYTDIIVGSVKGPIARAAYWVNMNILDGIVNLAGKFSVGFGRFMYHFVDQGMVDEAVNASGRTASGSGQFLRRIQTGQVRQYATLMFGSAAVLAGVFIVAK